MTEPRIPAGPIGFHIARMQSPDPEGKPHDLFHELCQLVGKTFPEDLTTEEILQNTDAADLVRYVSCAMRTYAARFGEVKSTTDRRKYLEEAFLATGKSGGNKDEWTLEEKIQIVAAFAGELHRLYGMSRLEVITDQQLRDWERSALSKAMTVAFGSRTRDERTDKTNEQRLLHLLVETGHMPPDCIKNQAKQVDLP